MTPTDRLLRIIRERVPELVVTSITVYGGQFNDVLIVNDAIVFRFPRTDDAAAAIETELVILRLLHGRVPMAIPNPVLSGVDDGGRSFMGYERLAGRSLDRPTVDALRGTDHPAYLALARQLAEFLAAIHGVPIDGLSEDIYVADRTEDWLALLEAFRSELYGFMRPDAIVAVEREFAAFLDGGDSVGWQPCLRHGDFGGANLLYDDHARELSGVIDFGNAAIGDPAVDLAGISAFDARLAQAMHATYPALFTPPTQRRASFYRSTFALQQALWALRADDTDEFNDGIASYR